MRVCTIEFEDNDGDLADVEYQCSPLCMFGRLEQMTIVHAGNYAGELGPVSWGGCPGGAETDYDVYCSTCGSLLWEGLEGCGGA